jgi:succinate dehydrogenase flavin-adding protein (antitoxin of CptAB toxin-antitoxin module)
LDANEKLAYMWEMDLKIVDFLNGYLDSYTYQDKNANKYLLKITNFNLDGEI